MASHTSSIWSFSVMAPTGQTAAHWPHCTQATVARLRLNAGPMTVSKPRFCGNSAPTFCISTQTLTQRRHLMHLPLSRTRAGVEASIRLRVFSPS